MKEVNETLVEREKTHGKFSEYVHYCNQLKALRKFAGNPKMSSTHQEGLDMIFTKIARILGGDPNQAEHWHDIAGYAKLVEKEITKGV